VADLLDSRIDWQNPAAGPEPDEQDTRPLAAAAAGDRGPAQ